MNPLLRFLAAAAVLLPPGVSRAAESVSFGRQILPILSDRCFNCHGPDEGTRKGGLRLDIRAEALKPAKSGEPAIVPGAPDASEMVRRLFTHDADDAMPPPDSPKKMSRPERELMRQWIAEGAAYEGHWAFQKVVRPAPPDITDGARGAIDRFLLAKLKHEGLAFSPETDKTTLLRRVTLDLIGLPPAPEEVAAFLADTSPDAYEKVLDRLFANPHYGERMALPWLDAARYADSNGFQQDGDTYQYVWRDWLVRALNANMRFDEFTVDQLAGDLLPNPTVDQKVATAFNRLHLLNGEGGAIAEEQRNVILFDRVDVTATTWLGLTLACAQCHDHKYDPLSQRDYYSMMAFFNNVPESGVPPGGGQYRIADPWIPVGGADDTAKADAMENEAAAARAEEDKAANSADAAAALAAWELAMTSAGAPAWRPVRPLSATADGGLTLSVEEDLAILAGGEKPAKAVYTLTFPAAPGMTGLRIEMLPDKRLPSGGSGLSDSGNAVLTDLRVAAGGAPVLLTAAAADYSQGGFSPAAVLDTDAMSGWAFYPDVTTPHTLTLQSAAPLAAPGDWTLTLSFQSNNQRHLFGKFRVSTTVSPQPVGRQALPADAAAALAKPAAERSADETAKVRAAFLATSPPAAMLAARARREAAEKSLADLRASWPKVMVMSDTQPRKTRVLDRGNYEAPRDDVQPAVPGALPPWPEDAPRNRLGLARWLVDGQNPLTARVQVNRYWQLFFGTGLVKTSENLGTQAESPTHPELLDWLAAEFVESGWDVKRLHRLIVTSAAYRQSSKVSAALREKDPENRLVSRGARFRMPSLMLRDTALAASGLLNPDMGGKPVYPYQPADIWDGLSITKERDFTYPQSTGADLHRRSLYTFWRRTAAPGNMFDASQRRTCSVRSSITSTPLHALTTLNDPTWVEAARALASRVIAEAAPDADARLARAFQLVCARPPAPEELAVLRRSFERALAVFRGDKAAAEAFLTVGAGPRDPALEPAWHAAMASACLAILNLDEALTRE